MNIQGYYRGYVYLTHHLGTYCFIFGVSTFNQNREVSKFVRNFVEEDGNGGGDGKSLATGIGSPYRKPIGEVMHNIGNKVQNSSGSELGGVLVEMALLRKRR